MKKRLLSTLLVLCMVLALLPGTALASSSGTCGENVTWALSDGTLTISGTGSMDDCYYGTGSNIMTVETKPWLSYCDEITTVRIVEGVTSVGGHAFSDCPNLTSVTIPDSVTSIGYAAFSDCSSLTSVSIPDGVTSIGDSAFARCSSLTNVIIPDGVTTIEGRTFTFCGNLSSVTIPDSVTSIGMAAFCECTSLTDVYYGGTENQWGQIDINSSFIDSSYNNMLDSITIHYNSTGPDVTEPDTALMLTPAIKYVYYSEELPGSWQAVSNSLPNWLSVDGNVLYGMPTQAGAYPITLTDGTDTQTVTLTVRENGDNSVRGSNSEGYVVVQDLPDIVTEESTWEIDEVEVPASGGPDIFDRLLDVYLDGRKLTGGKLADGQQVPANWEYYARSGSVKITIRTQTSAKKGVHTISANFTSAKGSVSSKAVDTVSTNFYVSSYNPQTEKYPFPDGAETRYRDAIRYLVESGVINGFSDGTFRPKNGLTRAQACVILTLATGNGSDRGRVSSFTDTKGHWAEWAIAWCSTNDIVSGYGNGKFGPDDALTGYQWSLMLFRALKFDMTGIGGSGWEQRVMDLLRTYSLDQGMNNFYPEKTIKREEACQLVYNALVQKLISI